MFSKLKDKVPPLKQSHIVYQIPCNNCNGVYIGQTSQNLYERLKGHKYSNNSTSLRKHAINKKHTFNYDNITILTKELNNKSRTVLEAIHIQKNKNSINDRTEIQNLSNIYFPILQ